MCFLIQISLKRYITKNNYYALDLFLCMSRYEGKTPTLVVSETMASGCLIIFSKNSDQEIIENKRKELIIEKFNRTNAIKILGVLSDKKKLDKMRKEERKRIKEFDSNSWGKKYFNVVKE